MSTNSLPESPLLAANHFFTGVQQAIAQIEPPASLDQYAGDLSYLQILLALSVSAVLGALIAYHPRRYIEVSGPVTDQELRKTQIVICVAGAIMVALIQGSLERAFGLVGLGSFVRYRTALRNPYDLSIIFILIGVGMACGLQYYEFALTISGFFYVLMFLLDINKPYTEHVWTCRIDSTDPDRIEKAFQSVIEHYDVEIKRMKTDKETGRFTCKFSSKAVMDKEDINLQIKELCGNGELNIRFDWEQEVKNGT